MKHWKLFLDDDADSVRRPAVTVEKAEWRRKMDLPAACPDTGHLGDWKIARDFDEASALFDEFGLPAFISFDHDLGDGKDGIAVAHLIVNIDLDAGGRALPHGFSYEIHSGNRVGRDNIRGLLESYLKTKV